MSVRASATGVLAALVLAGSVLSAPVASADPELRARVEGLLGAYRAATIAEWRAVGSGAAPVLEAVVRDGRALPTRRARALAALGVVQPAAAAPLIRQLASDPIAPAVLRSAAVEAAPGLLGAEAGVVLVPLLRDREGLVRQRSAEALAASGAAGCRAVLDEAKTRPDSDPVARTAARCEAQLRSSPGVKR